MKIHVPAYCPSVFGVHMVEYRGVTVLEKKVMDMSDMDIVSVVISIVEVLVAMLDIAVEVIAIAMVVEPPISMPLIDILSVAVV